MLHLTWLRDWSHLTVLVKAALSSTGSSQRLPRTSNSHSTEKQGDSAQLYCVAEMGQLKLWKSLVI